ncbi:long-chain fatty acid--CoA ligase [Pseudomaricurvus alkylphenolicus]|uniref:class I adenylate-forming enzyme family protein n=1 Tax=Pseudomaricurvus alkylphenolicus TaxID=1306991 RepID=UPI001423D14B|nr:AMP-binding protein [Pseudomaricurvus alkylphenolicus]NIB43337.1 long-chain fatty acid--CoA ligase [Pseudomaricurvus alkylphenolicus]
MTESIKFLPIDCLYQGVAINPGATAIEDHQTSLSYHDLVIQVEALALALAQQLPPQSRVALCAQNHAPHIIAFLAILAAGMIWIPVNPKNGAQLNRKLLQRVDPDLLMIDRNSADALAFDPGSTLKTAHTLFLDGDQSPHIDDWIRPNSGKPFSPARPAVDSIMAIKFTGGSTGEPKGVMQSHLNVATVVDNLQASYQFTREDCNLTVAPLTHGASHLILPILAAGARHLILPDSNTDTILDAFTRRGASVCFMPPTLIYKLLEHPDACPENLPHLRHLIYSAAPMPPARIQQTLDRLGPVLSTLYGQTEAPMTITTLDNNEMRKPELQSSVGRACKHSDLAILDDKGRSLPAGQIGEVAIAGPLVMNGYYREDDKTGATMSGQWLRTGDLGCLDKQGYLFLQGRSSDVIISGGFNVYPSEVENLLIDMQGITECVVFGKPDDYWGECVEAVVCLQNDACFDEKQLRQTIKERLGPIKTPKRIHQLEQLPRNPVGKVVRRDVATLIQTQQLARHSEMTK